MTILHSQGDAVPVPIPKQLMQFFTHSKEPWGIKDVNSRYVYANQAYFDFLNIRSDVTKHIDGFSYDRVRALAPLAKKLIAHDLKVMQTGQRLEAIGTLLLDDQYRTFIFEKYPFFDEKGHIVGTISHVKPFERVNNG